jgi:hypothetical protein
MLHHYHIFEIFPSGSSLWRARAAGLFNTKRKLQELAEHSENEFVAIDFSTSNFLRLSASGTKLRSKIENGRSIDSAKPGFLPTSPGPRAYVATVQPERRSRGT